MFSAFGLFSQGISETAAVLQLTTAQSTVKTASVKTKRAVSTTKKVSGNAAREPGKRYLTFKEVEDNNIYTAIESTLYRMCIKEVPFFLALHQCYYRDKRLNRGDTLVLSKKVLSTLLMFASQRLRTSELTISPVINIDSMMLYRPKEKKKGAIRCGMIIYTVPGVYTIPKTDAKISVPNILWGTVSKYDKSDCIFVTIFSKGVQLQLPSYAKVMSLGMITDMDIRYAELVPSGPGFEARLLYAAKEKRTKKRGWSLNVTECNKIRPYAR
jgi:hypothetical protein